MADTRPQWTALLRDMADVVEASLRRVAQDDPARQADAVVCDLARYIGGKKIYLPDDTRIRRAVRNARIWASFDGRNVADLARTFRLTERQIYSILRKEREIERQRQRRGRV
jgi:Mor family transcriptional regulator